MAWSPPALKHRKWLVEQARDYAAARFHHIRDGTLGTQASVWMRRDREWQAHVEAVRAGSIFVRLPWRLRQPDFRAELKEALFDVRLPLGILFAILIGGAVMEHHLDGAMQREAADPKFAADRVYVCDREGEPCHLARLFRVQGNSPVTANFDADGRMTPVAD